MVSVQNNEELAYIMNKGICEYENAKSLFDVIKENKRDDLVYLLDITEKIKQSCLKNAYKDDRFLNLYNDCLLYRAPYKFDDYMLYLEKDRSPEKQFYLPRRKVLKIVVDDLQDLEDGKLDFYGLSIAPITGKTVLCAFFISWIIGKRPNSNNLMSGHSLCLCDYFYEYVNNIMISDEYNFHDVFPEYKPESSLDGKNEKNFDKPNSFVALTCAGIDSSNMGVVDISSDGYLYVDDLVNNIMESLNPVRLENIYQN